MREHLFDGSALQKFEAMVVAQGGDLEDRQPNQQKYHVVEVTADEAGYISELPAIEFGLFAMRLGAGRANGCIRP